VLALPSRRWEEIATEHACETLTNFFRTETGSMCLYPVQAAALIELHDHGGCFLQAGVGQGKTLVSGLAAAAVSAKRPLLLVPANLKAKTAREFRNVLAPHWKIPPIRIESYEMLSRSTGGHMLEVTDPNGSKRGYRPDLIILDEGHKAKNPKSAVTRKLRRYIKEARARGEIVRVLVMSGTLAKRSLLDFAHLADFSHPVNYPLPRAFGELKLWAGAIDEKVNEWARVDPGALLMLAEQGEANDTDSEGLASVRRGVQHRIFSTPGFINTTSNDVAGCSLIVECHQIDVPPEVDAAFGEMKETWMTPDEHDISTGIEMWRHSRELALGFYYRWDPYPPAPWLLARQTWCKAVREMLKNNRRELDSEEMVVNEIRRVGSRHPLFKVWSEWMAIKPTFEPNNVPVWLSDYAFDWIEEWASSNTGLIWVEWPIVGQKIAKRLGIEYYGRQGLNARGAAIEAEPGDRCAVASIKANGTGRNLQTIWSKALVTSAPPTGTETEQMIGRIHRRGQLADEVNFDFMIACREQCNGFMQSMRDAQFHSEVLGSEMKLLGQKSVDIIMPQFVTTGGAWAEPTRD
jgi:hypothetical protein